MNHGAATAVRNGCACDLCRAYRTRAKKSWRLRTRTDANDKPTRPTRVPIDPVRAHVDALVASGWRKRDIADELGITQQAFWNLLHFDRHGPKRWITAAYAARILAVEPLEPVTVDDVAVERFIAGGMTWRELTREERIEAARRMDARGISRNVIAERTRLRSETLYAEAFGRVAAAS